MCAFAFASPASNWLANMAPLEIRYRLYLLIGQAFSAGVKMHITPQLMLLIRRDEAGSYVRAMCLGHLLRKPEWIEL